MLNIYTDGAHSSKSNVGGWAIVIPTQNEEKPYIAYGDWALETTNNRMELTAILKALEYIYDHWAYESIHNNDVFDSASIYTDSAYISNCFKDGWYKSWRKNGWKTSKKEPVANQDLWERILYYYEFIPNITIAKVSGHSNNIWNNMADKIAVQYRVAGAEIIKTQGEKNG